MKTFKYMYEMHCNTKTFSKKYFEKYDIVIIRGKSERKKWAGINQKITFFDVVSNVYFSKKSKIFS